MIGGNIGAAIHMLKVMNQQGGASQSWESYWAEKSLYFAGSKNGDTNKWEDLSGNNDADLCTMVAPGDSLALHSDLLSELTNLGLKELFFDPDEFESFNESKPIRPKDHLIHGNRVFGNDDNFMISSSPLTGDEFKRAVSNFHGINNYTRFLSTYDGISFIDPNGYNAELIKKTYFIPTRFHKFPDHPSYRITNNLTLVCRFQSFTGGSNNISHIFGRWGTSYGLRINTKGNLKFYIRQANGTYVSKESTQTYIDGNEYIIMCTADGSNITIKTSKEETSQAYVDVGQTIFDTSSSFVTINGMDNQAYDDVNGFVSDCILYNQIKTWDQIIAGDLTGAVFHTKDCFHELINNETCDNITEATWLTYYYTVDINVESGNKYYPTKIDLNPNLSSDSIYDIFDRRNVVGNPEGRPEIWQAVIYDGAKPFEWNIRGGTYNLNQATIEKYIQPAYKKLLYVKQTRKKLSNVTLYESDHSYIDFIIQYASISDAERAKALTMIDWPSSVVFPVLAANGVIDDSTAINAAFASAEGVVIYNQTARIQDSVKIPSDKYLIFASGGLLMNDNINKNSIRNADLDNGNSNIKLIGLNSAIIDQNAANQNRLLWEEGNENFYNYFNIFFCNSNNITVRGINIQSPAAWSMPFQQCDDLLIESITFITDNAQDNQDGIGIHFGTRRAIIRNIDGRTDDDFIPQINQVIPGNGYKLNFVSRNSEYLYAEDLLPNRTKTTIHRNITKIGTINRQIRFRNIKITSAEYAVLDLTDYSGTDCGLIKDVYFKNILVQNSKNFPRVIRFDNDVENINVENLIMKSGTYGYLIETASGYDLKNCIINSVLYIAPTTDIINDSGAIFDNFVHNETIEY